VPAGTGCIDVMRSHVSVRSYMPVEIPEEHVLAMMEAARRAPTDAALHLWTAVRVRDREKRKRIAEAIRQPHVWEASEFFVFLADLHRLDMLLRHRGETLGRADCSLLLLAAVDAGIAAENLAVAAESLGYGTCFIGAVWNEPRLIIRELGLPPRTLPLFGLAVGVPRERPPQRPRYPLDTLFHTDRYREYTPEDLDRIYREMAPITRRRDYLRLARRYAGRGGYFESRNRLVLELAVEQGFEACRSLLEGEAPGM